MIHYDSRWFTRESRSFMVRSGNLFFKIASFLFCSKSHLAATMIHVWIMIHWFTMIHRWISESMIHNDSRVNQISRWIMIHHDSQVNRDSRVIYCDRYVIDGSVNHCESQWFTWFTSIVRDAGPSCVLVRRSVLPICWRPHCRTIASATRSGRGMLSALFDAGTRSLAAPLFSAVDWLRVCNLTTSCRRARGVICSAPHGLTAWLWMVVAGGSVSQQRRPKKWDEMGGLAWPLLFQLLCCARAFRLWNMAVTTARPVNIYGGDCCYGVSGAGHA